MTIDVCKLCLEEKGLLKSHLMPAASYGSRKKELEVSSGSGTFRSKEHIKQPLLCKECEQRFDQNGETHVLNAIAPKNTKAFALQDRMKVAYARDYDPSLSRFFGPDFGLDVDKVAYFALSVVWRLCASSVCRTGHYQERGTWENFRRKCESTS